ncbi:MAG: multidrug transporter [Oscillochloridaceae bacterium]|nr:multidrug transporter [Chloroflexaceae bacterium]MDW8391457.1 multidrug transporter [Oscillochloridaceae bacterium]
MERIIIRDRTLIPPFSEPARELRILNKPLWLLQRDLLKNYCKGSIEIDSINELAQFAPEDSEELLVYRDNLYFNAALIDEFIRRARSAGRPCQIAFTLDDRSIERHATQLSSGIVRQDDVVYIHNGQERRGAVRVAELYYFPAGRRETPLPLVIETLSHEMGYYRIPSYMAHKGELTYQIPIRAFLSIENWLHVFMANVLMGVFSMAAAQDKKMSQARLANIRHWQPGEWRIFLEKLGFSLATLWQQLNPFEAPWRNHFLASKALVKVGKRCSIDPTAIIHGPTIIGDDVYIGPGVVIANSIIGNGVNIMQGAQIMLSVVSDRCFLPFNAGLFMTTLMENSMVAQNSTLQLCVVGRNTFIGANNCFTDFNLQNEPIKVVHQGKLVEVNMPVLGSAVGHNVKIGSGFIVYPGRMIESNAVIIFDNDKNLIRTTVAGHDLEDVDRATGEPRRIIYHWPHVYDNPAERRVAPQSPASSALPSYGNGRGASGAGREDYAAPDKVAIPREYTQRPYRRRR